MRHRAILPLLASLALAAAAFAQSETRNPSQPIDKAAKDEILAEVHKIITERAFVPNVDLKKWPEHLAKQQEAVDKAATEQEFVSAVNRAIREFGISHVRLRTPRAREARTRTSVVGIGLSAVAEKDALAVVAVIPNGPAAEAGIKVGDKIVAVDGKPAESTALTGDEGTEVTIKLRNEKGEERELKLKRARISTIRPEALTFVGEDAAVLKIFTFSRGYSQTNIEKLIQEASAKAKYLVLDLRGNGGGAVNNLQHLLSLLLPPDTVIGTFINRRTVEQYIETKQGAGTDLVSMAKWSDRKYKTSKRSIEPFRGRIAVLINRGSGSASEIAACALKEVSKAPLVGSRTAGAVLASIFGRLPKGFEIQYPVSDYVSANGVRLEGNPLLPDVEVTTAPSEGTDPAVEKALELLRKG